MKHFPILLLIIVTVYLVSGRILPRKLHVKCSKNNQNLWPDYNDKKFYFECISEDDFVKRPCPAKTFFNYYSQQCTWPEDWIKPPEFEILQSEHSPSCLESELHLTWPDPGKPQDYFRCTGIGESKRLTCPLGRRFVFLMQMCVPEETTTTTEIPVERFPNCEEHELHLSWPDPWYPKNFFICTGLGLFEIHQCRDGSIFVFMMQMCVRENELTTAESSSTLSSSLRTTTTETTLKTDYQTTEDPATTVGLETAPTELNKQTFSKMKCVICWRPTCEANELHLMWPDYDSSTNYFQCLSEGVLILKSCNDDLTFDFSQQICVA